MAKGKRSHKASEGLLSTLKLSQYLSLTKTVSSCCRDQEDEEADGDAIKKVSPKKKRQPQRFKSRAKPRRDDLIPSRVKVPYPSRRVMLWPHFLLNSASRTSSMQTLKKCIRCAKLG